MEEYNRDIVHKFYQQSFGDLDFQGASQYICPTGYTQHNPMAEDGVEAFIRVGLLFKDAPKTRINIQRSAAEGNFVWTHQKLVFMGKEYAVVDIFRFNCGKIVEHWDVRQPIGSGPFANPHPFF